VTFGGVIVVLVALGPPTVPAGASSLGSGPATSTSTTVVTSTAPSAAPPTTSPAPASEATSDGGDEIAPPTPEKQAEVEGRARAYLDQQPAARSATAAVSGGPAAVETADWTPWVGSQTMWCSYSNPGSPNNYCSGYHPFPALDIAMPMGTVISAAGPGQVVDISTGCVGGNPSCGGGAGNYVSIIHADGRYSRYMHLTSVSVALGANVLRGQPIGLSGWTGNVSPDAPSTAHLHYEEDLARYGTATDPGEMYSCQAGRPLTALASRGLFNWQQMPWGTTLTNDNYACTGADRDTDGIPDGIDNCPDVGGPQTSEGCDLDSTSAARTSADFNHDGRGDVAFVVGSTDMGSKIEVAYGQADGTLAAPTVVWDSGAFGWIWGRVRVAAGDFTHDGYSDLVLLYEQAGAGDGIAPSTLMFIAYGTSSGVTAPAQMTNTGPLGGLDLTRMKVTTGDYDGNGFSDLGVLYADVNNETEFFIGSGTAGGVGAPMKVWDSGAGWWNGTNSRVIGGDFDGDGRGDLGILQTYDSTHALLLTASGQSAAGGPAIGPLTLAWDSGSGGWDPERTKISAGDFDGDGRDDIGLLKSDRAGGSTLSVAYGVGVGLSGPQLVWSSGPGALDWQRTRLMSCDTARSGRASLGILYAAAGNQTSLLMTGADGNGGWTAPHSVWASAAGAWDGLHTQVVGCDLALPVPTSKFHALTPARLLDSRNGTGGPQAPWGPGESRTLTIAGALPQLPATGISSVVLNVTVTDPTAAGFLTAWPNGLVRPVVSNLNFTPGDTVANQVVVKVGAGGKIALFNNSGSVDVIADVVGYYDGGAGDTYNPLTPARLLDSRDGTGGYHAPWGGGESHDVQITGQGGVPASGVSAVLLNVTAVNGTLPSHLSEWPSGQNPPTASILNFTPGTVVPNLVLATVGAGGQISLYNNAGTADIIADVVGWYGPAVGSRYSALAGGRILDTRIGVGGYSTPLVAQTVNDLTVTGVAGVPATGVSAVVLNVTVTNPTAQSHLIAWPSGTDPPTASNLNFTAGQTVPNLVVVKVGPNGKVSLFNNSGAVDVIADVVGYYS
jgi:murein DD-endopeptidase MepM/ murein hydrolase activator NlpD